MNDFISPFKEELADYLAIRQTSVVPATYTMDCSALGSFDSYLANHSFKEKTIQEEAVVGWIQQLSVINARKTVVTKVTFLRNFLKYLQYCGIPVFMPEIPKVTDSYVPYIFSDAEMEKIFSAADSFPALARRNVNPYFQIEFPMILRMLYACGFRVGELLEVRIRDINFERGVLLLRNAKNKKQRIVPMDNSLTEMLQRYCIAINLLADSDSFLFPNRVPGKHVLKQAVTKHFKSILKSMGIYVVAEAHTRGPCLHCLRHLFAVKAFAQATQSGRSKEDSVPYLSIYLGHCDMNGTEKYLKFSSDMFPEYTALFEDYADGVFAEVSYEE